MAKKRITEGTKDTPALNRRELLARGAVVGAGAAMLVGTGAARAAANGAKAHGHAPAGITWDYETDVLVCGAGNGGMSAALTVAEGGAKTLLLEISIQVGGNTLMSAGNLHSNGQRTWEAYNEFSEGFHDQVLGKVYIETFWNEYIPFLQSMGAYMSRPSPDAPGPIGDWYLGKGEPGQLRHKLYFDSLVKAYQARGGSILLQTRVRKLLTDEEGNVFGVRAQVWEKHPREKNQKWISIKAKKVILAIGGWIMDGERKARYFGQEGYRTGHSCGPFSSGEGLDMAHAAGAAFSKIGWSTFASFLACITAEPQVSADMDRMLNLWRRLPPEEWTEPYDRGRLSPPAWVALGPNAYGGMLVNNLGQRFIDESSPHHAKYPRIPVAVSRQPGGFAWGIADHEIHSAAPGAEAVLKKVIAEGGTKGTHGNVIISNSLEEFAEALSRAGMYKGAFLKTIAEYNRAVDEGTLDKLPVSRFAGRGSGTALDMWGGGISEAFAGKGIVGRAIRTGPFYAIPVAASPYLIHGGIRIDADAQVLDAQGVPVPNLYAPPPLGGGVQNVIYMGAMASAGTFGYRAAKHALKALAT